MNLLIYDTEIIRAVPPKTEAERLPDIDYCEGWYDKAGMGLACLVAYDILNARAHIFLQDNLGQFARLVSQRDGVLGWNNHRFDDPLLEANGVAIERSRSHDLAALVWKAAGVDDGEHPKGMSLDAVCTANGLPGKTGHGAQAPIDWQQKRPGRVIDYCLGDVYALLRLYRRITATGGFRDPRTHEWVKLQVPR